MVNTIQCYVNVDEDGKILNAQQGENIIPSEDWDFFFLNKEEIEIGDYRIELNGYKKSLVLKSV